MIDKTTQKYLIATLISYILLILALIYGGTFTLIIKAYLIVYLIFVLFSKRTFKGKEDSNSYEYLWGNNKIMLVSDILLYLAFVLGWVLF